MIGQGGYSGKILRVDLSSGSISHIPTLDYADRFIGGRGLASRIYWEEVPPQVSAFDPENRLIIVTGPLGGFPGLAGSMWKISGKSPDTIPEHFCYCNLGGHWGAHLKFAGYDGAIVQGKSDSPVYLLIQNSTAEIRDASHLWGKGSVEVREILKEELGGSAKVMASGVAGDNMVTFATVLAENDASGGGGFGAVMGSKGLKAIAVRGSGKVTAARPEELGELTKYVCELNRDNLIVPRSKQVKIPGVMERQYACYGCICGCVRKMAETRDGKRSKRFCQSGRFYQEPCRSYYGEYNDVIIYANRLCNQYGLDTKGVEAMIDWMSRCREAGILTDESTGLPLSKIGSLEFIEALVRKISLREGFGDILARGTVGAAHCVGGGAEGLISGHSTTSGGEVFRYDPRVYITSGIIWAMEPRMPSWQLLEIGQLMARLGGGAEKTGRYYISGDVVRKIAHRFWGSEAAADFTTYEGKALAAKKIQDRSYAKECLILCSILWPNLHVRHSEEHVGDPTIESRVLSAVTGRKVEPEELDRVGERVFNLQRAILAREGHRGRESDKLPDFCFTTPASAESLKWEAGSISPEALVTGRDGEVISKKGALLDRKKFERMKDEYYELRGWDVDTGLQTKAKLRELDLGDIVADLGQRGLVV